METVINMVFFFLGLFLIYDGFHSLKQLEINNEKWMKLQKLSISFDQELFDEFQHAELIVKQLRKYIKILSKFSILDGFLVIVSVFIIISEIEYHVHLNVVGYVGIVLIAFLFSPFIISFLLSFALRSAPLMGSVIAFYYKSNKQYSLLHNYLEYEYDKKIKK